MSTLYLPTPTHFAYSPIWQEGGIDAKLLLGLVYTHRDGAGFNLILNVFPITDKIVCRKMDKARAGIPTLGGD